jgi:uncharacterized protein YkwD
MHSNKIKWPWAVSIGLIILLFLLSACSISIGGPASPAQSGSNASPDQIAQAVFQAINKSRADNGLPPLKWDTALVNSAKQHNETMAKANTLSHQLPGEPNLGQRETQQGIKWTFAAENIGVTTDQSENGALTLHQAMMNEKPPDDGHRQNILSPIATLVGVSILIDQQHGELWLTEDFAHT